ncbi:hypothetical protein S245_007321, partial [Arachis hypogaea]
FGIHSYHGFQVFAGKPTLDIREVERTKWSVRYPWTFLLVALGYSLWPPMVLISEIVQTFFLADFFYFYVKRFQVFAGKPTLDIREVERTKWSVRYPWTFLLVALGYGLWPPMVLISEIVQTFFLADFFTTMSKGVRYLWTFLLVALGYGLWPPMFGLDSYHGFQVFAGKPTLDIREVERTKWSVRYPWTFLLVALVYGLWPPMVLISEIVQTFFLADFFYYYVKSSQDTNILFLVTGVRYPWTFLLVALGYGLWPPMFGLDSYHGFQVFAGKPALDIREVERTKWSVRYPWTFLLVALGYGLWPPMFGLDSYHGFQVFAGKPALDIREVERTKWSVRYPWTFLLVALGYGLWPPMFGLDSYHGFQVFAGKPTLDIREVEKTKW